jgi:hypothetical protein
MRSTLWALEANMGLLRQEAVHKSLKWTTQYNCTITVQPNSQRPHRNAPAPFASESISSRINHCPFRISEHGVATCHQLSPDILSSMLR